MRAVLAVVALLTVTASHALEFRRGGLAIALDNAVSLGTAVRAEDRGESHIGLANGGALYSTNEDDGNLGYDRGDIVSAATKLTSDLTVRLGRVGFFARGNYFYNPILRTGELFDRADYLPVSGKELGLDELERKEDAVHSQLGEDASVLDAYLFAGGTFGGHAFALRVGRQTVNWGESLLIRNGLASLNALDLNRLHLPAHELTEVAVPAGMAQVSFGLTRTVDVEAFYQYEWEPTVREGAGTFWSVNDYLAPGGTQLNLGFGRVGENTAAGVVGLPPALGLPCVPVVGPLPLATDCVPGGSTIPRAPDAVARDEGQYGGAVTLTSADRGLEVTLHAANYHSRLPVLSAITASLPSLPGLPVLADTAAYFGEYPEDIRMAGVSFDFPVTALDVVVLGEYSVKQGQPLEIDDVELLLAAMGEASQVAPVAGSALGNAYLPGWRRHQVSEWTFGLSHAIGPWLGADLLEVQLEFGGVHVHDLPPENVLRYEAPGTVTPGDPLAAALHAVPVETSRYATADSWGYRLEIRPTWFNALGPFDLEPALRFAHDVRGITPSPLSNFVEGRQEASAALGLSYLESWTLELGYTGYLGAEDRNLLVDRDFYEVNLKRWF